MRWGLGLWNSLFWRRPGGQAKRGAKPHHAQTSPLCTPVRICARRSFRFARRHYTEVCRLLVVAICYVLVVAICYMLVVAIYYVYASLSGVSCSHMLLVSTCYVLVCHLLWVLTVS